MHTTCWEYPTELKQAETTETIQQGAARCWAGMKREPEEIRVELLRIQRELQAFGIDADKEITIITEKIKI